MKLQLVSDLHVDCTRKPLNQLIDNICQSSDEVDCLIIAGDFGEVRHPNYIDTVDIFAAKFKQVLLVLGNHEYYGLTRQECLDRIKEIENKYNNVLYLTNKRTTIKTVNIYGATLWYPYDPSNYQYERLMNDIHYIPDLTKWCYEEHECTKNLIKATKDIDVLVTHHLPSKKLINKVFKYSPLNRFFVGELGDLDEYSPHLYLFGHSHFPHDKHIKKRRFVSNPSGYTSVENIKFNPNLTIKL